jgi:hypothetical protein
MGHCFKFGDSFIILSPHQFIGITTMVIRFQVLMAVSTKFRVFWDMRHEVKLKLTHSPDDEGSMHL